VLPAKEETPPVKAESARRDTPTEMYVKGVHEPALDDTSTGDSGRDTPTRALDVASLESRKHLAAHTDPLSLAQMALPQDDVPDVPTIDMNTVRPVRVELAPSVRRPVVATVKLPIPPPLEAPPPPAKPRWQLALDRALLAVGRFVDRQVRAFRAAPQNTQIILVIVVGTATILAVGFVLFFALH
jgi:hypothetical protein